jgi:restriction endonuclease
MVDNGVNMPGTGRIRILEKDNNRRGDLFGRLASDLFVSLGYDHFRLNIARSGREIDIEAEHRLEQRLALAECKALKVPVGGKELNAFAGKLRAERGKRPGASITPYFVSLSGFTETAVDQEKESGDDALIMVNGDGVVDELIKGRILVPVERATEQAGQVAAGNKKLQLDPQAELLAHEHGWIWAVYYTQGKKRTHFVLVHADGTLLALAITCGIIAADRSVGGTLHNLRCLNPKPSVRPADEQLESEAIAEYHKYLAAECGYILLDGLPADAEVGSRRLQLENLFVPLHLVVGGDRGGIPLRRARIPSRKGNLLGSANRWGRCWRKIRD